MVSPDNDYTRMQKRIYAEESAKWSPANRDPVVGSWDAHQGWADYDLLFEGLDTSRMAALDFGCGPGRMIERYLPRFGLIDGADLDRTNLVNAHNLIVRPPLLRRPRFFLTDGVSLTDVPGRYYDLVYSTICLQHICVHAIRANLFREFARVLRPGGWVTAQMGFGDNGDPRGVGYYEDRWDVEGTNGTNDVKVTDPDNLMADLMAAGFDTFTHQIRPTGPADWHPNWIFFRARKSL